MNVQGARGAQSLRQTATWRSRSRASRRCSSGARRPPDRARRSRRAPRRTGRSARIRRSAFRAYRSTRRWANTRTRGRTSTRPSAARLRRLGGLV